MIVESTPAEASSDLALAISPFEPQSVSRVWVMGPAILLEVTIGRLTFSPGPDGGLLGGAVVNVYPHAGIRARARATGFGPVRLYAEMGDPIQPPPVHCYGLGCHMGGKCECPCKSCLALAPKPKRASKRKGKR